MNKYGILADISQDKENSNGKKEIAGELFPAIHSCIMETSFSGENLLHKTIILKQDLSCRISLISLSDQGTLKISKNLSDEISTGFMQGFKETVNYYAVYSPVLSRPHKIAFRWECVGR